jgi:hypothetical protein
MKTCNLNFTFNKNINEPIYVYYELTNYFQNHKRYFQSRSMEQLWGQVSIISIYLSLTIVSNYRL